MPQDVPHADLLGPLALEGPPVPAAPVEQKDQKLLPAVEVNHEPAGPLALATIDDNPNSVQVL